MKRVLSLDIGLRKTGAAITDDQMMMAHPLKSWQRKGYKDDLLNIRKIVSQYELSAIVIGNPLNEDGSKSENSIRFSSIAAKLKKDLYRSNIDIFLHDERFSTALAKEIMQELSINKKRKKELEDQLAAQIILTSWLNSNANKET